jgi:hypothetical protein
VLAALTALELAGSTQEPHPVKVVELVAVGSADVLDGSAHEPQVDAVLAGSAEVLDG